jgi:hypothetical protein
MTEYSRADPVFKTREIPRVHRQIKYAVHTYDDSD